MSDKGTAERTLLKMLIDFFPISIYGLIEKNISGQSTQQHIHNKLIEKVKEKLSTTDLSISEITYNLGFEHPKSFSKLLKAKTKVPVRI